MNILRRMRIMLTRKMRMRMVKIMMRRRRRTKIRMMIRMVWKMTMRKMRLGGWGGK